MPRSRDPDRTRRAILDAAAAEFSALGPAGARIDAIAAAAGVNKRMLYHYFTSKDGLFAAVLHDRLAAESAEPATLAERHASASGQPDRIRLLMWQALASDRSGSDDGARAAAWRERVAELDAARQTGQYGRDLDAAHLELTLAAIALFPFAFPQLTRSITGKAPTDPEFIAARSEFLTLLEARFGHRPDPQEAAKPRYRLAANVTESATQPPWQIERNTSK